MHIFPFKFFKVTGASMEPTLSQGDYVLVRFTNRINVGDIVVVKVKDNVVIKRVSKIHSEYFWVLGDNDTQSTDSRKYGWINFNQLIGKVVWKITG